VVVPIVAGSLKENYRDAPTRLYFGSQKEKIIEPQISLVLKELFKGGAPLSLVLQPFNGVFIPFDALDKDFHGGCAFWGAIRR
jgi:hypothetical protein